MASAGRNLLGANSGARDTFLFDDSKSQFTPEGWDASANFHGEWKEISANSPADVGGTSIFQIQDTLMDYGGDFILKFTKPAYTTNAGTFWRMVDFAGFQFIKSVRVSYGSNNIRNFTGYELQTYYHRMLRDRDEQDAWGNVVRGDLDAATRASDLTSAVTYYVRIPFWIDDTRKSIPISVLAHEINIEVTWASVNEVIQTDGSIVAPAPGINPVGQVIKAYFIHVPSDEQAYIQNQSDSEQGLIYLINDTNSDSSIGSETITAGATSHTMRLSNLKGPVVEFLVTLRLKTDADTSLSATKEPFLRQKINTLKITGSGLDIIPSLEHDFLVNVVQATYHSGPPSEFIYPLIHSTKPEDSRDHNGSLDYFNITNPQLEITFDALAADAVLDIIPVVKNLVQFKSGDMRKMFA